MGPLGGTRSMELEESFKMKITKAKLNQIIKEELEVTLTNEEAAEMFGEGVRAQLEEQQLNEILSPEQAAELPMVIDGLLGMSYTFAAPMLAALLARLGFEAGATAMAKDALERKDKNWLLDFIHTEVSGKQTTKDAEKEFPMAPPPPMMEQEQEKETPLAKAQSDNSRAYTNADPKEKALISKLEASLLQMAADTNLLADPAVIRALKLLNQALEKTK